MKNKQEIKGSSDLIIELIALKENLTQECVLATFCKVIEERVDNKIIYKVKVDSQKLNVSNYNKINIINNIIMIKIKNIII